MNTKDSVAIAIRTQFITRLIWWGTFGEQNTKKWKNRLFLIWSCHKNKHTVCSGSIWWTSSMKQQKTTFRSSLHAASLSFGWLTKRSWYGVNVGNKQTHTRHIILIYQQYHIFLMANEDRHTVIYYGAPKQYPSSYRALWNGTIFQKKKK